MCFVCGYSRSHQAVSQLFVTRARQQSSGSPPVLASVLGGRQKMIRTFPVGFGIQRHLLELWRSRGELSSQDAPPAGLGWVMDERISGHPGEIVGTGNKVPGLCCSWQEAKCLGNP